MKTVSAELELKETSSERKPVELYRLWVGSTYYYYNNSDVSIDYGGHTYDPAPISRSDMSYNSSMDVSTITLTVATVDLAIVKYIAQNPIETMWVEVSKYFFSMETPATYIVFVGQIKQVGFKGSTAEVECVGFEHFLSMRVPVYRYQLNCNHRVFDSNCGLTAASYKVQAVVTLNAAKTILTSATFALQANGYFIGGLVQYDGESRVCTNHVSTQVTLAYPMLYLADSETVDIYPGCDGRINTCRDKFNNIANFFGFPFIPEENPALRVS